MLTRNVRCWEENIRRGILDVDWLGILDVD